MSVLHVQAIVQINYSLSKTLSKHISESLIMTTPEKYTIPLSGSNYSAWSIQIEMILREKKIWKVVNGEEKKPAPDDDKYNIRLFSDSDDNSSDMQDFDSVTY